MAIDVAIARPELLQVADAVAREKSIERDEVLEAMEQAIQKAGRAKYGHEHDIRAEIDRRTGEVRLRAVPEVGGAEPVENEATQMPLAEAQKIKPGIELGRLHHRRSAADRFRPHRRADRQAGDRAEGARGRAQRQFDEYKDRVGEIVNGIVKRNEFGNVTVDLGRAEAMMRRDESMPRETFRTGDRVRAYIYDVREEPRGPQIFLSRTPSGIHGQAVRPGSAGNLRRHHRDQGGGPRSGQPRQDRRDQPRFLDRSGRRLRRHARQPRAGGGRRTAGRKDRHHSLVAGFRDLRRQRAGARRGDQGGARRGRQAASRWWCPTTSCRWPSAAAARTCAWPRQLTGWDIDILTEDEESERRQEEFRKRTGLFVEALDVDDVIAGLLVQEGFGTIEDIIQVEDEELADIEGFDETVATELKRRAGTFVEKRDGEFEDKRREMGVDDVLAEIGGFSPAMMVTLGEKGVKTLDDLADLAGDELIEMLGAEVVDEETANAIVMEARRRAGWFGDEDIAAEAPGDADA